MEIEQQPQKVYLTIKQFVSKYPWPSESGLRAIVQQATERGFSTAVKRFYRRVLIDPQEFFACLERIQKGENGSNNGHANQCVTGRVGV